MKILIDSDIFCKLGLAHLLEDAIHLFGAELCECERLGPLPHMLRRGSLRNRLGSENSDRLIQLANGVPELSPGGAKWIDRLTPLADIDPGEALLFAAAAEGGHLIMTGDKRALRSVRMAEGLPEALVGRVVTLEAVLLGLCDSLGINRLRKEVEPLLDHDQAAKICFGSGVSDPRDALRAYQAELSIQVQPLVLWNSGS